MPELPEVETVCRGLRPILEGRRLTEVLQRRATLRFPLPADFGKRLTGRRIERIERRAKYIVMPLSGGEVLLCHLGMSGRLLLAREPNAPFDKHDHVVFTTDEGCQVRYNDARRFGLMDLVAEARLPQHRLLAGLGLEPLGDAFDGPRLAAVLRGKTTTIKAALLDQRIVAGLGNIYAAEALFAAGLLPTRPAATVQGARAKKLAEAIRTVLTRAIAAGGSSLRDYVQTDGELGYFQQEWAVYGRAGAPCASCDCNPAVSGGVQRLVQGGRSTFYCPRRQS